MEPLVSGFGGLFASWVEWRPAGDPVCCQCYQIRKSLISL